MERILHIIQMKVLISCLLIVSIYGKLSIVNYVKLETKFATLIGTHETVSTTTNGHKIETSYYAFRGIPYSESPVGRWTDPILKPALPKGTVLDATADKSACPQWISKNGTSQLIGDEQCLYASIYVPVRKTEKLQSPLKIMIFFHGGGFILNANRNMLPIPLLAMKNCIIVMFNYRVSIFGFLSTGTSSLPGNYAFLDQITLLKWIQIYGRDFGGDSNDVTVFGSSIGSVSIHFLLLSKLSAGLFHKAIMESGSAFCERSIVPNPLDISVKVGTFVGCPTAGGQDALVSCLRSKSTLELMTAAKHLSVEWVLPSVLGPVIDKNARPVHEQFLPDFPENLPIVNKVPIIAGITKEEGLTAFVKLSQGLSWDQLNNLGFIESSILPHYLNLIMRTRMQFPDRGYYIKKLSAEVMGFYRKDFEKDAIATLVGILGDLWINTCHRKTLEHLCMNNVPSVYAYLFTHHDMDASPSEIDTQIQAFHESGIDHPILDKGVAHTEEILYMLQQEVDVLSPDGGLLTISPRNQRMSVILSSIWEHFAVYGSIEGLTVNGWSNWNPVCYAKHNLSFHSPDFPLYEISLDNHRVFSNYRLKETQFWWRKHLS